MNKIYTKNGEYFDKLGNPVYTGICYNHPFPTPYLIYYDKDVRFSIKKKEYKKYKNEEIAVDIVFRLIRPELTEKGLKDRFIILKVKTKSYVPYKRLIFNRKSGDIHFEVIEVLRDAYL